MPVGSDGIDDGVSVAAASFVNDTQGSFSLWVKITDLSITGTIFTVVSSTGDIDEFGLLFRGADNNKISIALINNGTPSMVFRTVNANVINDNNNHHIIFTSDGSTMRLYIDNAEEALEQAFGLGSNTGQWFADAVDADIASLGISDRATPANPLAAVISEVGVWDVELSSVERENLFGSKIKHMPLQIRPANLQMYLPMDDGPDGESADGDAVRDLSGNGNDGTGDDGANNSGLTWKAEEVLSYPVGALPVIFTPAIVGLSMPVAMRYYRNMRNG